MSAEIIGWRRGRNRVDNPTYPSEPRPDGAAGRTSRARRRLMVFAGATTASVLVAAALLAVVMSGSSHATTVTSSSVTSTTGDPPVQATTVPPEISVPSTTVTTQAPPVTTTAVAPAQRPAPTTSTTLACRNSYNPSCGPFRWDPAPAPAGAPSVSISYTPSHPVAGEQVTFTVTVSDPDTSVSTCGQVDYGAGIGQGCSPSYAPCPTRYGPWDPPAEHSDFATTSYTYQYKQPGSYTFSVSYPIGGACYDPYQTHATGSVTATVGVPPTTTPAN